MEAKEPPVPKAESAGESTAQRTPEDVERVPRVSLSTLLIGCEEPPTGERETPESSRRHPQPGAVHIPTGTSGHLLS